MPSQSEIDKRKAILRARSVPEAFIDNLARRKGLVGLYVTTTAAFLAVLAASLALSLWAAKADGWLTQQLYPRAADSLLFEAAHNAAGVLSPAILGLGALVMLAGGLWLVLQRPRPFPAPSLLASHARTLRRGETMDKIAPTPGTAALAGMPDDQAFLTALHVRPAVTYVMLMPIALIVVAMTLAPLILLLADHSTYTDVTLDEVRLHHQGRTETYRLADADYAYVLCYGTGARVGFDYRIRFPGRTVSLPTGRDAMHDLDGTQVLERVVRIDQRLAAAGVRIDRPTGEFRDRAVTCVDDITKGTRKSFHKESPALRRLVLGE